MKFIVVQLLPETFCVPRSGAGQDCTIQQAERQGAGPAHRQDDGVQGSQDIALCVVGQQGLRQLG